MKFNRQFDPSREPSEGVSNNKPSLTIPDQSLTVREIFMNHTRGIPFTSGVGQDMYYGEDGPMLEHPDDITELQDAQEKTAELMDVYQDIQTKKNRPRTPPNPPQLQIPTE
jgi:hypothetical protein